MEGSGRGGTRARRAARSQQPPGSKVNKSGAASSGKEVGASRAVHDESHDRSDQDINLEEQRDFLLRSIEDLNRQHSKGEVSDEDYAILCDDYTARAAAVIRAMESPRSRTGQQLMASTTKEGGHRPGRTVLVIFAVIVVGLGAGVMVARSSGTAPTNSPMADASMSTGASGDKQDEQVTSLLEAAQTSIAEGQSNLRSGDGAAAAQDFRRAITNFDQALKLDPANVEAMTYRGWLLHNLALQTDESTANDLDAEALEWLNRAVETEPDYPDARVFRAVVLDSLGRPVEALADLDAIDVNAMPTHLTQLVESRRAAIEAELNQTSGTGPVEGGT